MNGRLIEHVSATEELASFLGRKDFRVMWNPKTAKYETQQHISGGWDSIPLVLDGVLTHLIYPCWFWSTILTTPEWNAGIKYEVHWGLVVPGKEIVATMRRRAAERKRDDDRQIADASRETAKGMWQATPHKTLYSTA